MKIVTVVEMQSRLPEMLAQPDTELTQVTYKGDPVVAVLDLEHYQTFQTVVQSDDSMVKVEMTSESLTQGQHLFHSYRNRLAPRLESHEQHVVKVIELTRRKKLVGALLAWRDWQRLMSFIQQDEEHQTHDDHHLTIVGARNHLLKLSEQFTREEQQGIFAPVRVSKQRQGEPVMVIVPWGWFERVTSFLRTQHVPFTRMEGDGAFQLSSNENDVHSDQNEQAERLSEPFRHFSTQWSVFHQTASEIAVAMAHREMPSNASLPFVDPPTPDLEELCVTAARQALELRSLVIQYRQPEGEI